MYTIEEHLGREDTQNKTEEVRFNVRINKYGCLEDNNAYEMIKILKDKNINISKHIRLLLSLEYTQQIHGGVINVNNSYEQVLTNDKEVLTNNEIAQTYDVVEVEDTTEHAEPADDDVF